MKKAGFVSILAAAFGLQATVATAGKSAFFDAPPSKVFSAALVYIGKHYRVEQANPAAGFISFRSGMSMSSDEGHDGSVVITTEEGRTKVYVNTEKRGRQLITWGEGGQIQKNVLEGIAWQLARMPVETPTPTPTPTAAPTSAPVAPVSVPAGSNDPDTRLVFKNGTEAVGILLDLTAGVYTLRLRDGRIVKYHSDEVERMEAIQLARPDRTP